jgi:hypothetical protein
VEEIYRKLESEEATVRYIVLIFLGAGINFSIGVGVMLSSLSPLVRNPTQALASQAPIQISVMILVISYFIMGIIYATCFSLMAFQPKRIISPLYVQIITSAFVPILIVALQLLQPITDWVTVSSLAFGYFLISFVMFFAAGIGQTIVVRYLVGLNGTKEDTNSIRLLINGKLEDVLKVLRRNDLQEALLLDRKEERKVREHSHIFRTSRAANKQLFIAVIADSDDNNKTHLATVSYSQRFYGILKSGDFLEEERKHIIKFALKKSGMMSSKDVADSPAQLLAYYYGLAVTESKLLSLRSLPPHTKVILGGLVLMTTIMTFIWKIGYITLEMYETFLVFVGFSVLFDLLPLLRTKRKSLELD